MNLDKIKEIIDNPLLSDSGKELAIFECIAQDKNALPSILSILNSERESQNNLNNELNLLLSKSDVILNQKLPNRSKKLEGLKKEVDVFYDKNQIHCFRNYTE